MWTTGSVFCFDSPQGTEGKMSLRRREFIAGLGGAAIWPLAARAQQGGRVRRIGVLTPYDENDPLVKPGISAFTQALADLGWAVGRNVRIDVRWGGGDTNRIRALARGSWSACNPTSS